MPLWQFLGTVLGVGYIHDSQAVSCTQDFQSLQLRLILIIGFVVRSRYPTGATPGIWRCRVVNVEVTPPI